MMPNKSISWLNCFLILALFSSIGSSAEKAKQTTDKNRQQQEEKKTETEDFKIRVDVDLVTTDVTVIGTPVAELQPEDFILYDNKVSQEITYFSRDKIPFAIAILIDGSGSIIDYLPVLQLAALSSLRRLNADDQVALFSFTSNETKLIDLTEDRSLIAQKIGTIKAGGYTNIFDPIYNAVFYLKKSAPDRHRVVILISDNQQTFQSFHYANDCLMELLESNTTLFNIRVTDSGYASSGPSDHDVIKLAEETGTEVLNAHDPASLKTAMENTISNLRKRITLGFNPANPGKRGSFHRLSVQLKDENRCPGCRLAQRKGYYAGVSSPLPPQQAKKPENSPRYSPQETDELLMQRTILTAGTSGFSLSDIPFAISTAEETTSDGLPQVRVDLKIDLGESDSSTPQEDNQCKLQIAIIYCDKKGKILGNDWKRIGIAQQKAISYTVAIPLKSDNEILKVIIYDEGTDRMGSKYVQLNNKIPRIPRPAGK
jgi:Ca-activated chloride channel homolog